MYSEREMEALAEFFLDKGKENPRKYMESYRNMVEKQIEECKEEQIELEEKDE